MSYSQYGEEKVLMHFFSEKMDGFVVDVGAADGVTNSNSRYLVEKYNWRGLLLEPHPSYFNKLKELYENNPNVTLVNKAVSNEEGTFDFFIFGGDEDAQVSTLSTKFKKKVSNIHGDKYRDPIKVVATTLEKLFVEHETRNIDFLSIDCEGLDMQVLQSNNWDFFRPKLVCVEHSMAEKELLQQMNSISYKLYLKTMGNSFFVEK